MKDNILKTLIILSIAVITIILGCYYYVPGDVEYKEAIIRDSNNPNYELKNMNSIVGEKELAYIIKKYDKHPEYYMSDVNAPNDRLGVKNLTYRAGLHSHTTASDGALSPEETLDQAAKYADEVKAKHPFRQYPFIIAITDHYTTDGCKQAIDLIQKNPDKYKNLKIVLGMETTATTHLPSDKKEGTRIHILLWAVNPFDPQMDEINFLPNYTDTVKHLHALQYGLIGVAHPLRYFVRDNKYDDEKLKKVMHELFSEYSKLKDEKILFTEGYYQPYRFEVSDEIYKYTQDAAKQYGIYRTGSQDTHGRTIFANQ